MKLQIQIPRWSETFILNSKSMGGGRSGPKLEECEPGLGFFYFLGSKPEKKYQSIVTEQALDYQKETLLKSEKETVHFVGKQGLVWIQRRSNKKASQHHGLFQDTLYALAREGAGSLVALLRAQRVKTLRVEFWGASAEEEVGFVVGFDLGAYQFRPLNENQNMLEGLPTVQLTSQGKAFSKDRLKEAQALASAVNWSRHLVNLPGQDLNPHTFSKFVVDYFKSSKNVSVNVWNEERLAKEGMGLHLAVGQGAHHPPCLVHLSYRPSKNGKQKSTKKKPIAIVGKGITFDTGGLDLKPSSAMRWMKKDMGGAATVFGLCAWINEMNLAQPTDFYLAIAENSVGPKSFRPGDIFKARNGMTVEIHNTDAEGRLVLADALDVAIKSKEAPACVIDVATLTGAIKVALGADVPGLFSNNDSLAAEIQKASHHAGEVCWRIPLVQKYSNQLTSSFAHLANASEGFGGAITAALFLEKFVGEVPWAHLDIYSWNDKPSGGLAAVGGSGQGVQLLASYIKNKK